MKQSEKRPNYSLRHFLLLLIIALSLSPLHTPAQVTFPSQPKMVRIHTLEDLNEQNQYALIAKIDGKGAMLSTQTNGKKLLPRFISPLENPIDVPTISCIWKFQKSGTDKWTLWTLSGQAIVQNSTNDIALSAQSAQATIFNITATDGIFRLASVKDEKGRCLMYHTSMDYFGFFIPESYLNDFHIYRYATDTLQAEVTDIPADFCFAYTDTLTGKALLADESGSFRWTPIKNYTLRNESLAADAPCSLWTVDTQGHLSDQHGRIPFPTPYGYQWKMTHGIPVLCNADGEGKVLACSADNPDNVTLQDTRNVHSSGIRILQIRPIAPSPQTIPLENGLYRMEGGWSVPQLQQLQVDHRAREIDFTLAWLPKGMPTVQLGSSPNCVLYFSAADSSAVHPNQSNAISCSSQGNQLIRSMVLTDRKPYYFSRSFHIHDNQMGYERTFTDSNWNTCVLPFTVADEEGICTIMRYQGRSESSIYFAQDTHIKPYELQLIKFPDITSAEEVLFMADEQTIQPTPDTLHWQATDTTFLITNPFIYVLDNDGTSFVHPQAGSFLYPFRGYVTGTNSTQRSLPWQTVPLNSIRHHAGKTTNQPALYDLQGKKLSAPPAKGLYITRRRILFQK